MTPGRIGYEMDYKTTKAMQHRFTCNTQLRHGTTVDLQLHHVGKWECFTIIRSKLWVFGLQICFGWSNLPPGHQVLWNLSLPVLAVTTLAVAVGWYRRRKWVETIDFFVSPSKKKGATVEFWGCSRKWTFLIIGHSRINWSLYVVVFFFKYFATPSCSKFSRVSLD